MQKSRLYGIQRMPEPRTFKELEHVSGVLGFNRTFIEDYSTKAEGLEKYKRRGLKPGDKIELDDEGKASFEQLKRDLLSAPVLRFPDFSKPFTLETDASGVGVSATLFQGEAADRHPIAFISRRLTPVERTWHTSERECLAYHFACCEFWVYLHGRQFRYDTDHQALLAILPGNSPSSTKKVIRNRLVRMALDLQEFQPDIHHKPGKRLIFTDGMSRMPAGPDEERQYAQQQQLWSTADDQLSTEQRQAKTTLREAFEKKAREAVDALQKFDTADPDDETDERGGPMAMEEANNHDATADTVVHTIHQREPTAAEKAIDMLQHEPSIENEVLVAMTMAEQLEYTSTMLELPLHHLRLPSLQTMRAAQLTDPWCRAVEHFQNFARLPPTSGEQTPHTWPGRIPAEAKRNFVDPRSGLLCRVVDMTDARGEEAVSKNEFAPSPQRVVIPAQLSDTVIAAFHDTRWGARPLWAEQDLKLDQEPFLVAGHGQRNPSIHQGLPHLSGGEDEEEEGGEQVAPVPGHVPDARGAH